MSGWAIATIIICTAINVAIVIRNEIRHRRSRAAIRRSGYVPLKTSSVRAPRPTDETTVPPPVGYRPEESPPFGSSGPIDNSPPERG